MNLTLHGASLMAQTVKNLPAMQVTQVRSLGCKDPLEKGMATHSSILAGKIPKTEKPGRLQSMGLQKSERLILLLSLYIHSCSPKLFFPGHKMLYQLSTMF